MSVENEETLKSPIINGVLCYTSSARHSVRNDDIVRICLSFLKMMRYLKEKISYATLLERNQKGGVTKIELCMKLGIS